MSKKKETLFGIAMRNFTKYPEMPSATELINYGVRMEELGYESIWAWDHILLGVEPNFPIHEALILLTAIAARTTKIKVGTGILVMPGCHDAMSARLIEEAGFELGFMSGFAVSAAFVDYDRDGALLGDRQGQLEAADRLLESSTGIVQPGQNRRLNSSIAKNQRFIDISNPEPGSTSRERNSAHLNRTVTIAVRLDNSHDHRGHGPYPVTTQGTRARSSSKSR